MSHPLFPETTPGSPIEKEGYSLIFQDEFDSQVLDHQKWFPFYLPHWSSRNSSIPNYIIEDSNLVLQISHDQKPWCPEFDGEVKCSSIQTGEFAGAVGSQIGQHQFYKECVVREAQENVRLFTPVYGYFEMRARAVKNMRNHVALWMIGYEDQPERSAEIAIFEIMGAHVSRSSSRVGHGVRRWGDPNLVDEFYEEFFPIDAAEFHIYSLEWRPGYLEFRIDNIKTKTIQQSPGYPMQFMLGIYELPLSVKTADQDDAVDVYPKNFTIDYFRAYQPVNGYF